jgi:hypothetical protein
VEVRIYLHCAVVNMSRIQEVLELAREVYKSGKIKSKVASSKKTQKVLKTMLKTIFPQEGKER